MRHSGRKLAKNSQDFSTPVSTARRSHARAKAQCRPAVRSEMPSAAAASGSVRPAKYRSFTTSACSGNSTASRSRAASSAIRSSCTSGAATRSGSRSTRARSPPRFAAPFRRARSTKIRRIASAAAAKKWPREEKEGDRDSGLGAEGGWSERSPSVPSPEPRAPCPPTIRKKASCTNAVACSVCPGFSCAKRAAANSRSS